MKRALPLAALLLGCGTEVAAEMEAALATANHGIAVSLLATEPAIWADASDSATTVTTTTTLRHGSAGDCPRIARDPDDGATYQIVADYGNGCVTGSQVLPAIVSGTAVIDVEGETLSADLSSVTLDLDRTLGGVIEGTFTTGDFSAGESQTLQITGEIDLPKGRSPAMSTQTDLVVFLDESGVLLNGEVGITREGGTDQLILADVLLPWDKIAGECPRPKRGTITVVGSPDLVVHFADGEADQATVQRKGIQSEPVRICSFASDTW